MSGQGDRVRSKAKRIVQQVFPAEGVYWDGLLQKGPPAGLILDMELIQNNDECNPWNAITPMVTPLDALLKEGHLTRENLVLRIGDLAKAVAYMHEQKIAHFLLNTESLKATLGTPPKKFEESHAGLKWIETMVIGEFRSASDAKEYDFDGQEKPNYQYYQSPELRVNHSGESDDNHAYALAILVLRLLLPEGELEHLEKLSNELRINARRTYNPGNRPKQTIDILKKWKKDFEWDLSDDILQLLAKMLCPASYGRFAPEGRMKVKDFATDWEGSSDYQSAEKATE
ncbi:hypothetical protein NUU61_009136 [Penicillium alfredii]|uniref:Protein kinase domain-containing protein n=1 Tax=Penicillium alfredii TaxID=1506179 RepID=A0A9W9JXE2_9EURO|nr:uncharacterized protein NUU61_009136 [Penicillium alfredii]KAJ5084557.1 hypothetical protein NUU61_009136 [Penicillium alfredii]